MGNRHGWHVIWAIFLTQFFYLRGGGAIVLTVVLLIEWWMVVQVFRRFSLNRSAPLYALIPIVIECFLHSGLLYPLSVTVSIILVLGIFLLYAGIDNRWGALAFGLLALPLLYIVADVAFFLFPVLIIVYEVVRRRIRLPYWLLLVAMAVVFPSLMRPVYLLTPHQAYRYPFATLRISGIDLNREKILALASESYFESWTEVYELIDTHPLPNAVATYYTNIALSKQNKLPDKLLEYYQPFTHGLFLQVGPNSNWIDIFFSSDAFFHVGDMNMAQHSAMLGMIFSPKHRSSRMVKRLAEINLVNGDTAATRKYMRMLDATMFHSKWAAEHERMLTGNVDDYPWLKAKRSQIATKDILRMSDDYPKSLSLLVESNPDNKYALDYLLCFYLLNKDVQSFARAYDTWCKGKPSYRSRLYDEALLIKLAAAKANPKEVESYALPTETAKEFADYTRIYDQSKGNMEQLREHFDKTYWFYYHFAQMKEK